MNLEMRFKRRNGCGLTFEKGMNLEMMYLNPDMSLMMRFEKGNESRNEIQTKKWTWVDI